MVSLIFSRGKKIFVRIDNDGDDDGDEDGDDDDDGDDEGSDHNRGFQVTPYPMIHLRANKYSNIPPLGSCFMRIVNKIRD